LGAVYISGCTPTTNITTNGATPDNVHVAVATGQVYQLHRQTFPAISTGPYYRGNTSTIYAKVTDLNALLEQADGTAIINNQRFNLVIWGAVNYASGDCKLFVNLSDGVYSNDAQAQADVNNTADLTVPDDMRSVAFLIARVALKYTTLGGGTWTELGTYSLLGTPVGARSGGAAAVAATEFQDSTFRIFDDGDDTKEIAFQASGITTGTTRTITMPDADIDLTPTTGDFQASLTYSAATVTTGNTTGTVGEIDYLDIDGATAAISWTLPSTASVGDQVGVALSTDAEATIGRELKIYADNAADKINGTAGFDSGTAEWTRLLISGEVLIFRCVSATNPDWVVEVDKRIPCQMLIGSFDYTHTNTVWETMAFAAGDVDLDVGGISDPTNNRIVARRAGKFIHIAQTEVASGVADKRCGVRSANDTKLIMLTASPLVSTQSISHSFYEQLAAEGTSSIELFQESGGSKTMPSGWSVIEVLS